MSKAEVSDLTRKRPKPDKSMLEEKYVTGTIMRVGLHKNMAHFDRKINIFLRATTEHFFSSVLFSSLSVIDEVHRVTGNVRWINFLCGLPKLIEYLKATCVDLKLLARHTYHPPVAPLLKMLQ